MTVRDFPFTHFFPIFATAVKVPLSHRCCCCHRCRPPFFIGSLFLPLFSLFDSAACSCTVYSAWCVSLPYLFSLFSLPHKREQTVFGRSFSRKKGFPFSIRGLFRALTRSPHLLFNHAQKPPKKAPAETSMPPFFPHTGIHEQATPKNPL